MKKQQQVVRVVLPDGINDATPATRLLIESLRYAGLVEVHRADNDGVCFDLICPHGLDDKVWAKANAERMQSFGYNAVVAPGTHHLLEFQAQYSGLGV